MAKLHINIDLIELQKMHTLTQIIDSVLIGTNKATCVVPELDEPLIAIKSAIAQTIAANVTVTDAP